MHKSRFLPWVHAAFVILTAAALWHALGNAPSGPRTGAQLFVAAVLLYAVSHLLRYFRLLVLLMERRPGYGALLSAHFVSAWVSALLPFRIGEAYRLFRLSEVAGSWRLGFAAYGVEKFFDAAFLLGFVIITLIVGTLGQPLVVLLVTMTAVVVLSVAVYGLADGSLSYAGRALLLWGRSKRSLWLLHLVDQGRVMQSAVQSTVQQRGLPLLVLTLAIWLLDFSSFSLLAGVLEGLDASHWTGFLASLQGTLGSAPTAAGGAYEVVVVSFLTFAASSCIATGLLITAPRSLTRRCAVRPYRLAPPRNRQIHG